MPVGQQSNAGTVNGQLTSLAISLREVMHTISNLNQFINGQGGGLGVLEGLGFSSAADSGNPGDISDAQLALSMLSYMNTVAAVYYGSAAQTPAFNFDQELSQLWAGQ